MAFWIPSKETLGRAMTLAEEAAFSAKLDNKEPEPDLATKPKDIVGYCFGYVCPKKHVNRTFEAVTADEYVKREVCQACGGLTKPAVVKRTAEARWVDYRECPGSRFLSPSWGWAQKFSKLGYSSWLGDPVWTRAEFVHYLDAPKPQRRKK